MALVVAVEYDVTRVDEPTAAELLLYQLWLMEDKRTLINGSLAQGLEERRELEGNIQTLKETLRLKRAELEQNIEELEAIDTELVTGRYGIV